MGPNAVYNALRLSHALLKKDPQITFTTFLMADSVAAAKAGQKAPEGFYNIERMLKRMLASKGEVLLCGTYTDARGIDDAALIPGVHRSSMDELASATFEADKVLAF